MPAKYTTLAQLTAAFKSGDLDKTYFVSIDKGGCALSLHQHPPAGGETSEQEDDRYKECQAIFRREYEDSTQGLLEMAGIPAENC